jgi:hypothetical protein
VISIAKYSKKEYNMKTFKQFISEEYKIDYSSQGGSNKGGKAVDSQGNQFYVKHYKDGEHAKVEALTSAIYHHMGINTLEPHHEMIGGKHSVVTKWQEGLKPMGHKDFDKLSPEQAEHVGKMYHGAVLTKNWDITGTGLNQGEGNMQIHPKTGRVYNVDPGGSFHYRAQGGPKEYGSDISEKNSFRNPDNESGQVFNKVFKNHPDAERKGLEAVRNMDDDHLHHLFKNSGLSNWQTLHKTFMERKAKLLKSYGAE